MIDFQPLAARDFQLAGVQAQLVQDGGVDVGDIVLTAAGSAFEGSASRRIRE